MLDVHGNHITNSIPSSLGMLDLLFYIDLSSNKISHSIPTSFGLLTSLEYFYLFSNDLTGSLPLQLSALSLLQILDLRNNYLSQSIPDFFDHILDLSIIKLNSNQFSKTLPDSLGRLQALQYLDLDTNMLSRGIPTSFGTLSSLQYLYLYSNSLTGAIPTTFESLTSLIVLDLHINRLDSTLPTLLGSLPSIEVIFLSYNSLTGSIPLSFGSFLFLQELDVSNNLLTQSIPDSFSNLVSLQYFYLHSNLLSSTIPSSVGFLTNLRSFNLQENSFSGVIPSTFGCSKSLQLLYLQQNYLSGSIPSSLGNLSLFQELYLQNNFISNTIPSSIGEMFSLRFFNGSSNYLVGSLPSLRTKELRALDLSFNQLSSAFKSFGNITLVEFISLSQNCFNERLSSKICTLLELKTLLLDNLGGNCKSLLPLLNIADTIGGSIPSCIWEMSLLKTFHVLGNGLSGSLPDLSSHSLLSSFAGGSNRFLGSIPLSFQNRNFNLLQLSFNRIAGTLDSTFKMHELDVMVRNKTIISNQTISISLFSNRLSGTIPQYIKSLPSVDVVAGNIFGCSDFYDGNDVNSGSYVCGSMKLTEVAWFTEGILVIVLLTILFSVSFSSFISTVLLNWNSYALWSRVSYFPLINAKFLVFWSVIVAVLLTVYILLGNISSISTHTFNYGWVISVSPIHGWIAFFIVGLFTIALTLSGCYWFFSVVCQRYVTNNRFSLRSTFVISSSTSWKITWILFLGGFLNLCVLLVVNGIYVYTVIQSMSDRIQFLVSILISVFKMVWTEMYPNAVLALVPSCSLDSKMGFELTVNLINFLVVPIIVTMAVDVNCFLNVFTDIPPVQTVFESWSSHCYSIAMQDTTRYVCDLVPSVGYSSIIPPWMYSFQCSSSIITSYLPVIMYSYLLAGIILPFFRLILISCIEQWNRKSSVLSILSKMLYYDFSCDVNSFDHILALLRTIKEEKSRKILCRFLRHVVLLFTFGLACPIVIVLILIALSVEKIMFRVEFIFFNQYLKQLIRKDFDEYAMVCEASILGFEASLRVLHRYLLYCMLSVVLFWAIFVFDMIGDVYGVYVGWIVTLMYAIVFVCSLIGCDYYLRKKWKRLENNNSMMLSSLGSLELIDRVVL